MRVVTLILVGLGSYWGVATLTRGTIETTMVASAAVDSDYAERQEARERAMNERQGIYDAFVLDLWQYRFADQCANVLEDQNKTFAVPGASPPKIIHRRWGCACLTGEMTDPEWQELYAQIFRSMITEDKLASTPEGMERLMRRIARTSGQRANGVLLSGRTMAGAIEHCSYPDSYTHAYNDDVELPPVVDGDEGGGLFGGLRTLKFGGGSRRGLN
ncbi:MAG: hypothetical protein AAFV62_07885 [Pseudomonadota bacterium]